MNFLTSLPTRTHKLAPSDIVSTGVSQIQTSFPANELPGIMAAYMRGIRMATSLSIARAGTATLVALSQEWFRMQQLGHGNHDRREIELKQTVNDSQKSE